MISTERVLTGLPVLSFGAMGLPATHPLDLAKHAATQKASSLGDVVPEDLLLEEVDPVEGMPGMEIVCFT